MLLRFTLLTALYLLGIWYATAFIGGPAQVTLFWPSAGVAFAAVVRYGWRNALFIPVAVLIAHLTFSKAPPVFIVFSMLANLAGALAGAYVVGATGVLMSFVTASIGTVGLVVAKMIAPADVWTALFKWAFGDVLGIICIAPALM